MGNIGVRESQILDNRTVDSQGRFGGNSGRSEYIGRLEFTNEFVFSELQRCCLMSENLSGRGSNFVKFPCEICFSPWTEVNYFSVFTSSP